MKQIQQKAQKRTLAKIILVVAIVFVLAGGSYLAYATGFFGTNPEQSEQFNQDEPTDEQVEAGKQIKESAVDKGQAGSDEPEPPIPQENGKSKVVMKLTATNVSQGTLQIRTLIEAVIGSGNCELTLTKSENSISKTSDIQPLPSTSTCKGFDIPTNELSSGEWNISVKINDDLYEGEVFGKVTI